VSGREIIETDYSNSPHAISGEFIKGSCERLGENVLGRGGRMGKGLSEIKGRKKTWTILFESKKRTL